MRKIVKLGLRMHKSLDVMEFKEIHRDAKVLNWNSLCIKFRCSEKSSTTSSKPFLHYHSCSYIVPYIKNEVLRKMT